MANLSLKGMRVLVLEDEFLIAMDVEQLCRDHGAEDVVILRSLDELDADAVARGVYHAAVVDVMLSGVSTVDFAQTLLKRDIPFVFATGYADHDTLFDGFPGVKVVPKPYGESTLIDAMNDAIAQVRQRSSCV